MIGRNQGTINTTIIIIIITTAMAIRETVPIPKITQTMTIVIMIIITFQVTKIPIEQIMVTKVIKNRITKIPIIVRETPTIITRNVIIIIIVGIHKIITIVIIGFLDRG